MTKPKVSIVLATRNETAMLCVTVLSAVEALKESGIDGEIVVVENSDEEVYLAAMACLAGQIKEKTVRVIRHSEPSISAALQKAHNEALGEYIFYTDAHTLIGSGTLTHLLDFFARHNSERIGFVYAPIQWAHCSKATRRTHFYTHPTDAPLGQWSGASVVKKEQKVSWKGMPYMVQKKVWDEIGGFGCCAEHNLGWGVLPYIGIKTWICGYENWAIPGGVVYHFGEWPEIVAKHAKYRTYQNSGAHPGLGRAVALYVFGDEEMIRQQFDKNKSFGRFFKSADEAISQAKIVGEVERQDMLTKQLPRLRDILNNPPWERVVFNTISNKYRELNTKLHENASVKYGYKGHQQANAIIDLIQSSSCENILDYGAGKQTLSAELKTKVSVPVMDYDPSIPAISSSPSPADLVVCCDVLEHVEPEYLDAVLDHLRTLCRKKLFVRVCTVPCTSKSLPDGSNPHRIIQPMDWWKERLFTRFSPDSEIEASSQYFTLILSPS